MYGSFGIYVDPWRISPGLASMSAELYALAIQCKPVVPSQPLGGLEEATFLDGQLSVLRLPLIHASDMTNSSIPPCFAPNDGGTEPFCVQETLPSLADLIPYTKLAFNARPSSFIKSELGEKAAPLPALQVTQMCPSRACAPLPTCVYRPISCIIRSSAPVARAFCTPDFGTVTWSAWGSRLLSEFGYGTIASTSLSVEDTRRMELLDNNPAGHNTVIVREAFQSQANGDDETEINFSQFNGTEQARERALRRVLSTWYLRPN